MFPRSHFEKFCGIFYLIEVIKRPSTGYVNLEFIISFVDRGGKSPYGIKSSIHVNPLQDDVNIGLACPERVYVREIPRDIEDHE